MPWKDPLGLRQHINDIFYFVKKGTLYNYADDNTLSYGHPDYPWGTPFWMSDQLLRIPLILICCFLFDK
jgi:hypothetical protein